MPVGAVAEAEQRPHDRHTRQIRDLHASRHDLEYPLISKIGRLVGVNA